MCLQLLNEWCYKVFIKVLFNYRYLGQVTEKPSS